MGTRPEFLVQALNSIRLAGSALVHVVAPPSANLASVLDPLLYDALIDDPAAGLAAAIDAGLRSFPSTVRYINWLGDDDLLTEGSLDVAVQLLEQDPSVVLTYGACEYIDSTGKVLWLNKSGSYARYLMRFGPQLIPQPGSLFKRNAYERIGGLDYRYKWAFDLDLLIRLSRVGRLHFEPRAMAKFRWHMGSLSVGGRADSVNEASAIRVASLPRLLRLIAPIWEYLIRILIMRAGERLTLRIKGSQQNPILRSPIDGSS